MALTQVSGGGIKDGQIRAEDLADGAISASKLDTAARDDVYTLGANGSDHYTFTGKGLTGAVEDPTLYLIRGQTYRFVNGNSSGAHPFRIQTTVNGSAGTEYNTGVTNNGGAGGSTIIFEVPHAAPDVLYYQCTSHGSMGGIFYITGALPDGGVTEAKIASGAVTNGKLAADAVTTAKIANSAVTNSKLGDDCVTGSRIADNAVGTEHIADQAVTLAKLPHGTSSNDGKFLRANNGADPTFESITIPPSFVSGMIMLWSGAENAIPSGWVLCNGSNSTPDLRNRFVVGAGDTYSVGNTGGADSVTLTESQIPSHTHTTPNHNHSFSGSGSSSHNHSYSRYNNARGGAPGGDLSNAYADNQPTFETQTTQNATVSLTISGTTGNASPTTNGTGGGSSHENRPPYYALCYIMKT